MTASRILAEQNIQSLIKWKWNADSIVVYKSGNWHIQQWLSPSITQPSTDEIKAEISNYQKELDKTYYQEQRRPEYPSVKEQLDLLWHSIDADADLKVKLAGFYNAIKAIKDKYPKS